MGPFDDVKLYRWTDTKQKEINILDESIHMQDNTFAPGLLEANPVTADNDVKESDLTRTRKRVNRGINESFDVFSQKQQLLRSGKYIYMDSKGKTHHGSKSPSRWYMKPVLDSLRDLDALLERNVTMNDEKAIKTAFFKTAKACEKYLNKRKDPRSDDGKARRQMVADFYEQIKWESMRFSETIEKIGSHEYAVEKDTKWSDILGQIRTTEYVDGQDGIRLSRTGAATSDVLVIEDTVKGKKKFFKRHEKVPKDDYTATLDNESKMLVKELADVKDSGAAIDEINKVKERNEKKGEIIQLLRDALDPQFSDDPSGVAEGIWGIESKVKTSVYAKNLALLNWLKEHIPSEDEDSLEKVSALTKEYAELCDNYQTDNSPENEQKFRECGGNCIIELFNKIHKDHVSAGVAINNARIVPESELSKRNVATSRLAKMLGIEDLIVKSQMTEITVNGVKMKGVMMEDAGGEHLSTLERQARDNNQSMRYSPNALKQLATLQVFDIICGQVDRHGGNYRVKSHVADNTIFVDEIIGIDNDMSFGAILYSDIKNTGAVGYNKIRNIEQGRSVKLPHMDRAVVTEILKLDPKIVSYQMADILSKLERECLEDRIRGVQRLLRGITNRQDLSKRILIDDNDEEGWKKAEEEYKRANPQYLDLYTYYKPEYFGLKEAKEVKKSTANSQE
jgi:hypothetical protein